MEFKFRVQTRIGKPVKEVFEAIVDPKKLSGYFVGQASARLEEGKTVMWRFGEKAWQEFEFPVIVTKVVPNELIQFQWEGEHPAEGKTTQVEMKFEPIDDGKRTLLSISEASWKQTEEGLKASYGNCEGWTGMSMALKAYLEYGINLRKGAYE